MRAASWVLGYHGCDEAVLAGEMELLPSENDWDWLGTGIYFWEHNAKRALNWAEDAKVHPEFFPGAVKEPFVVGAVIDLGNCLDVLESDSIRTVSEAHEELRRLLSELGVPMPKNSGVAPDRVVRRLDCAVINYVHDMRA